MKINFRLFAKYLRNLKQVDLFLEISYLPQ